MLSGGLDSSIITAISSQYVNHISTYSIDYLDQDKYFQPYDYQLTKDSDYIDLMVLWYRDVLLFKATSDVNHLVFREEISAIRRVAQRSSYEGIEEVIEALDKAKRRLDANVNFDLTMELLMLEIKENG